MNKPSESIKGIPLNQLKRIPTITTTEENVLSFLKTHSKEGFTIDLFQKAGFSTNIRKIIQKLVDHEKIIQSSYQEPTKKKWEYVYYLAPVSCSFELKKTPNGWKVSRININGHYFLIESEYLEEYNQLYLNIQFPKKGDGIVYMDQSDQTKEWNWHGSIRYSEIVESYPEIMRGINILQEIEDYWEFEINSLNGKRNRISKSKSVIEGTKIELWAGNAGFSFEIDEESHEVIIEPIYRELDEEGNRIDEDEDDGEDEDDNEDEDNPTFDNVIFTLIDEDIELDDEASFNPDSLNAIIIPDAAAIRVKARK